MDIKLFIALFVGKCTANILKLKGSGATAAPGLFALKIDPNLVKKLTIKNNLRSIVISGTNGKTTTARLIYEILKANHRIIHNRAGSNLLRGVASTLIENSSFFGKVQADLCLWECDEAALVPISKNINIETLVLLNLFRDQLDRYGEIDTIRNKWKLTIENLPKTATLILNSDDPSTNYLALFSRSKNIFFGVETDNINLPQVENVADVKYCIVCQHKLSYSKLFSAHLGKFTCAHCNFKRTSPQISASTLSFNPNFSTNMKVSSDKGIMSLNYGLPGLYNVYNVLAAISTATVYKTDPDRIKNAINKFAAAFGRFQTASIDSCETTTFLIKNPAGANEVIRILATKSNLNILAILNDKIADGRDVSWIWDTNWEALDGKVSNIYISGSRAYDLALRLKYAQLPIKQQNIITNIKSALSTSTKNSSLIILPTYTAMLELQKYLEGEKWHEQ